MISAQPTKQGPGFTLTSLTRMGRRDPNGSCLFAAESPTDSVGRITYRHCRPDHLPTLSAAKISELSLLVKLPFRWRSGRCRQSNSDFLLLCAGKIEADHADSGIVLDCADRNRETPHPGD